MGRQVENTLRCSRPPSRTRYESLSQLIDYAEKNDPDILHLLNEDPLEEDHIRGLEMSDEEISYDQEGQSEGEEEETEETEHTNYNSKIRLPL